MTVTDIRPEACDSAAGVDVVDVEQLDKLDRLRVIAQHTEIDKLLTMHAFLSGHGEDTVDRAAAGLPGRQRAVTLGGPGTPRVAEFAPALVAGRLGISAWAAARLCADVLDLARRLPLCWSMVNDYRAVASLARLVAAKTRSLTPEQVALVDARVAESTDGRLPFGRFVSVLDAAVLQVEIDTDPDAVRQRDLDAQTEQFANPTRSTEHGMRGFYVRAPFPVIARLDATVAHFADALDAHGVTGTLDERRVLAMLVLANPVQAVQLLTWFHQQNPDTDHTGESSPSTRSLALPAQGSDEPVLDLEKLLPAVVLYVHLTGTPGSIGDVARVETIDEPLSSQWVRPWFGPRCRFTIKPVVIPESQTPVDAWEIPARHREAVHLMTPADTYPWAANTTRAVQIDHTTAYEHHGPPGQSRIGNYGPMVTFHHRLKTHGGWKVKQPFPGLYLWRDPTGATYLIDQTGTRRLDSAA